MLSRRSDRRESVRNEETATRQPPSKAGCFARLKEELERLIESEGAGDRSSHALMVQVREGRESTGKGES